MASKLTAELLDPRWVEHTYFLERRVTPAERLLPEPAVCPGLALATALRRADGVELWYITMRQAQRSGPDDIARRFDVRLATSGDGVHFEFPDLGLHSDEESLGNVVLKGNEPDAEGRPLTGWVGFEGWCLLDAEAQDLPNVRGRYTAITLTKVDDRGSGVCVCYSEDGRRWHAYEENPVYSGWPDTFNNCFFDERIGRYVLYLRPEVHAGPRWANRLMARAESDDLVHWDSERIVLDTNAADAPAIGAFDEGHGRVRGRDKQFYGMTVARRGDLYVGLAQLYDVVPGSMWCELVHSFDGVEWRREAVREPLIVPQPGAWDSGMVTYVAAGSPVEIGGKLLVYYGGNNFSHHASVRGELPQDPIRGIGVAGVPSGRLVGYHAAEQEGMLLTRPFEFQGEALRVNVDASGGQLLTAVCEERGAPIPGYAFEDADPIREDGLAVRVAFRDRLPEELKGREVRLQFRLTGGSLYGFTIE